MNFLSELKVMGLVLLIVINLTVSQKVIGKGLIYYIVFIPTFLLLSEVVKRALKK